MFDLERNRLSDVSARARHGIEGGTRTPTASRLREAGGFEEQRRLLSPGNPGLDIARPVPGPVPEPDLESVDIHVVDDSDLAGSIVAWRLRGEIKDISNVSEMVDRVLARAAGKKIGTLHIWDHGGGEGAQWIGDDWIARENNTHHAELGRLTGHFASDGQVVLHGCMTAEGAEGPKFLAFLAGIWGVPVRGSEANQHASMGSTLQGPTVECSPEDDERWHAEASRRGAHVDAVDPDCSRDSARDIGLLEKVQSQAVLLSFGGWQGMKKGIKKAKFW